ncbi:MAG: hypothetical protein M1481_05660 [Candidatus Thermoplasmatota archaeon]|jgi:hypothetical protein|nr:hypothetical protein [Candidatus Thermoplasmatota archaeon]MCL5963311.1 hypothetical protein [Candidatus Thermoplasmatota archaeon]
MIDWILSKVWIAITVIVLIVSVMGVYVLIYNNESNSVLVQTATSIGQTINSISTMQSNYTEYIVYTSSQRGLVIPKTITKFTLPFIMVSSHYTITIQNKSVILTWQGENAYYPLSNQIHPWNLSLLGSGLVSANSSVLKNMDSEYNNVTVISGVILVIERVEMSVNGYITYETFVHAI